MLVLKKDGKEYGKTFFPKKRSGRYRNVRLGKHLTVVNQEKVEVTVVYTKKISPEKYSFAINYKINGKQGSATATIRSSELPKKVLSVDGWEVWAEKRK